MWLFESPKDYPEMLKKIAWSVFFIVAIGLFILSQCMESFADFMKSISFGIQFENQGIKLYVAYIYIPLALAIIENIFKLHDRVSDVFRIRYRFDKFVIINAYLQKLKMLKKIKNVNKHNRERIMNDIFYEYASSTKPVIDTHLIYMALGAWSWYWIIIDAIVVSIIIGTIMICMEFIFLNFIIALGVITFLIILSIIIKCFQCKKYAMREVDEILKDSNRNSEIYRYLKNAL
jgi:hypothetical protein